MRCVLLFLASLALVGSAFGQDKSPVPADKSTNLPERQADADKLSVGEPVRFANLTVFPVSSLLPKNASRFITLNEGLKAKTVEVMELGTQVAAQTAHSRADNSRQQAAVPGAGGPNVNRLLVLNRSEKPLYLMPGEIVIGGQQDRAIGHEYVIAPSKQPVPIDVFCVEHGRWQDRVPLETAKIADVATSSSPAAESIALSDTNPVSASQQAASGKFAGSVGNVSKEARLALQGKKSQQSVWDRVAQTNQSSGMRAMAGSGAFTGNYIEPKTIKRLEPYIKALSRPVSEHPQVVGILVAVNGKVETLDVFESTPLFLALWPKLLKSYALDAANAPRANGAKPCSREQAEQFLAKITAARSEVDHTGENLVLTTRSSADVICFSAQERSKSRGPTAGAAAGMGGGMGGGIGGSVHSSGFAR